MYVCEACRKEVDPRDDGIVMAYKLEKVASLTEVEELEGMGELFHASHFPGGGYRRLEGAEREAAIEKLDLSD